MNIFAIILHQLSITVAQTPSLSVFPLWPFVHIIEIISVKFYAFLSTFNFPAFFQFPWKRWPFCKFQDLNAPLWMRINLPMKFHQVQSIGHRENVRTNHGSEKGPVKVIDDLWPWHFEMHNIWSKIIGEGPRSLRLTVWKFWAMTEIDKFQRAITHLKVCRTISTKY